MTKPNDLPVSGSLSGTSKIIVSDGGALSTSTLQEIVNQIPVVSDGDKGDITVASSGTSWTIDADTIVYSKIQNVSENTLLGRTTDSGDVEEITLTPFGRSILDDADAATVRTTINVDVAGTDNSTDVTLAGTPNYLTLSGQEITLTQLDLTADVTGILPLANMDDDLDNYDNSTSAFITSAQAPIQTVNTQTGIVVLDPDDLDDTSTTNKFTTAGDISKLASIEANADVTDEANVTDALDGATLTDVGTPNIADKILLQDASDSDNLKYATYAEFASGGAGFSQEEVEDIVGAMTTSNTETLITVTYQDADGTIDFVVDDDLSNYDNSTSGFATATSSTAFSNKTGNISQWTNDSAYITASSSDALTNKTGNISQWTNDSGYITATLTDEEVEDIVGAMTTSNTETLITVTYQDADGTLDFVVDNNLHNYSWASVDATDLKVGSVTQAWDAILDNTTASYTTAEETKLAGIETGATEDQTDEEIQDAAWDVLTGTQTRITVTYQDGTNDVDFVVDDDLSNYDNSTSGFATATSSTAFSNKTGNISQWTNDSGYITATLTDEEVEDIVGGMLTGNTELGITVTYQDGDGTIDFDALATQEADATPASGTVTLDCSSGDYRKVTPTGNFTLDVTPISGRPSTYVLEIVNGGAHTITWTGVDEWPDGGTAPTLTASGKDLIGFVIDDDGVVAGFVMGLDFA